MKSLLLVEQDLMLADMYMAMLKNHHKVQCARSAQEAIDILDEEATDLVITDIQVDDHNGIELIHTIRSYEDWIDLPLVILSSLPEAELPLTKRQLQRYGISAYLYKPEVTPKDVLNYALRFA